MDTTTLITNAIERAIMGALTPDMRRRLTRRAIEQSAIDAHESLLARAYEAGEVIWTDDVPTTV